MKKSLLLLLVLFNTLLLPAFAEVESQSLVLELGGTYTASICGSQFETTMLAANQANQNAIIKVSSSQKTVTQGNTYTIGGHDVHVDELYMTDIPITYGSITLTFSKDCNPQPIVTTTTQPKNECESNEQCDDGNISTKDYCNGSPKHCHHDNITKCLNNDSYCPTGCNYFKDNDCCQTDTDCNDDDFSTKDTCINSSICIHNLITECLKGDGYCPKGCNYITDPDCNQCRNSLDCEDNDSSTTNVCDGYPLRCINKKIISCISNDEFCPLNCTYKTDNDCNQCNTNVECNDELEKTYDVCVGKPYRCKHLEIKTCNNNDGYCPENCTFKTDSDCDECIGSNDCDDQNSCTNNNCLGNPKRCTFTKIKSGCSYNDICLDVGTILNNTYCNSNDLFVSKKELNSNCSFDYECSTLFCNKNICSKKTAALSVIRWFSSIFK
jgi:hypothetical protein